MRRLAAVLALAAASAWAGPLMGARPSAAQSPWVEVKTPHFRVFCDGSKSDARNVALQMERMRAVFQQAFPNLEVDPPAPIEVLAVRNAKEMSEVEPAAYLGKGKLTLGGYFRRTPDHDQILMLLSAPDDTYPYRIIYHEYTHLITSRGEVPLPVWLDEGLAEFYESTTIDGDNVALGKPESFNVELLREQPLIPLATLLAVDDSSPYYHEEDKGSIFYAESWALTHYFMLRQRLQHTHELADYITLLQTNPDPVVAGERAFGSLAALQKQLQAYIRQLSFRYVIEHIPVNIDAKSFTVTPLPVAQADAVRGEFLAWNGRSADATELLHRVLAQDPNNARALASLGYIAFQQKRFAEAAQWYGRAAAQAPNDFLDQYYTGVLLMHQQPLSAATAAEAATALQAAIRLNPAFAPTYDTLAVLYADQHEHLNQADRLELQAISLDPANFRYRLNTASILVSLNRVPDAITVLQAALPRATTAAEKEMCTLQIARAQEYEHKMEEVKQQQAEEQAYLARNEAQPGLPGDAGQPPVTNQPAPTGLPSDAGPPTLTRRPVGPKLTYNGKIVGTRCAADPKTSGISMTVDLVVDGKTVTLQTPDFLHVSFEALNFTPHGVLNPCTGIQGMNATVTTVGGEITQIVLSK